MDSIMIPSLNNGELDLQSNSFIDNQQPTGRISMKNCDRIKVGPEYKIHAENITIVSSIDANSLSDVIQRKTKEKLEQTEDTIKDVQKSNHEKDKKKKKYLIKLKKPLKKRCIVSVAILILLIIVAVLTWVVADKNNPKGNNSTTKIPITTKKPPSDFFVPLKKWSPINNTVDPNYKNKIKDNLSIDSTSTSMCNSLTECIQILINLQKPSYDQNINYNYLIGGDGRLYEARGNDCPSDPTFDYNDNYIKIGFIGDYSGDNTLNKLQEDALLKAIEYLINLNILVKNYIVIPECCNQIPDEKGPGDTIISFLKSTFYQSHWIKFNCECVSEGETTTESTWWWFWK